MESNPSSEAIGSWLFGTNPAYNLHKDVHFVRKIYLGMFTELQETAISFVMSVRLSALNNLAPFLRIFMKFGI
jgi:hypothetical protein